MAFYRGSGAATALKRGSSSVAKIYRGSSVIWQPGGGGGELHPLDTDAALWGHWVFDAGQVNFSDAGTEFKDRSANARHLPATAGMSAGANIVAGKFNDALKLGGSYVYKTLASPPSYNAVTIAAWVRVDAGVNSNPVVIFTRSTDSASHFGLWFNSSTLRALVRANDYSDSIALDPGGEGAAFPNTTDWVHVAMTADGTNMRLYKNGVQLAAQAMSAVTATTVDTFNIGGRYTGSTPTGSPLSVDDVRVYSRALTAQEVADLAAMTTAPGGGGGGGGGAVTVAPVYQASVCTGYFATVNGESQGGGGGATGGGDYDEDPPVDALTVGSGKDYATISAAVTAATTGDWILVDAGTYTNDYPDINGKDLRIRGVGGRPVLVTTQDVPNGVGILRSRGDATTILENLEFRDAQVVDENGAGVRYESGHLTVRDCVFDGCENGILANTDADGTVTLENCDFTDCGFGDGYTHGIYINGVSHLIVDGCYFYANKIGHHLKSRALQTTVRNCTFDDGTAETSRSIDISNGGVVLIENCQFTQSAPYGNPDIIGYGPENDLPATNSCLISYNVFNDTASNGIGVNNYQAGVTVQLQGNVFNGVNTPVSGAHQYLDPEAAISTATLTDDV